ncbi:MAG: methyltransferase family protein [Elusimicrobiota bacterium]
MNLEEKKLVIRNYLVRNRVCFGLLLGSGVLIFMRPGSQWVIFAGLFVSFVGLLIRSWAAGCIKKSKSLCVEGPYTFVRHPLYLGSLLMSAGIAAVFTTTDSLWLSGIFWVTYALYFWGFYTAAVTNEEKLLAERFSDEWIFYKERVPAFLPFRLPQFKNVNFKSFSFAQYNKNKEYNTVLGWVGVVVLILC